MFLQEPRQEACNTVYTVYKQISGIALLSHRRFLSWNFATGRSANLSTYPASHSNEPASCSSCPLRELRCVDIL